MLTDAVLLASGLLLTAAGVAAWTGAWRWGALTPVGGWIPITAIPMGVALILIGITAILDVGNESVALLALGLFFLSVALMIWEPRWLQPSWYQEPERLTPIRRSFIAEALGLLKDRIDGRGRDYWRASFKQDPGVMKASRATYVSDEEQFYKAGLILAGRPGWLALHREFLTFRQHRLWDRVLEGTFTLRIPLEDIGEVEVTKRAVRKALAATKVGELTSFRRRLRIVEDSREHLFLIRHPDEWARLISRSRQEPPRG